MAEPSERDLAVFIITRHNCLLRIERARELAASSGLLSKHPEVETGILNLIDAISVMVSEVLFEEPNA